MSRRKLPESQKVSDQRTTIRFRPSEKAAARRVQKARKLPTLSALLRRLIIEADSRQSRPKRTKIAA